MFDVSNNALVEKWSSVLDHDSLPGIKDSYRRKVTAVLLENQNVHDALEHRKDPTNSMTYLLEAAPTNAMGASSSTAGSGSMDIYDPVLISMVRRAMPNLMAYDVCGVQPMQMPTGLIFALRARYGAMTGAEALFQEANTTFGASDSGNTYGTAVQTGTDPSTLITTALNPENTYTVARGMSTAQGEGLGEDNPFNEMAMSIEKVSVTARTTALRASYTHELAQDLKNVHGLDAETELANIVTREILAEMNRKVIRSIYQTATVGAQYGTADAGIYDLDVDSSGRWMVEKFKGLMFQVEHEANEIAKATRMGKGNFIITSSDVASAFAMSGLLDYQSALTNGERLEVDDTGNTFAGTLFGRVKVFVDPYFQTSAGNQFVTVGYKGKSPWDAGLIYSPYIPLQMFKATDPKSFQPSIGFKTRYGLTAHPYATSAADGTVAFANKNKYYRVFAVKNLV